MGSDIGPATVRRVHSEPNGNAPLAAAARPAWASPDWDPTQPLSSHPRDQNDSTATITAATMPLRSTGVFIPLQGATAIAKGRHNKAVRAAAAAAAAASRALTPGGATAACRRSLDATPDSESDDMGCPQSKTTNLEPCTRVHCPRSPAQRRATFSCGSGPHQHPVTRGPTLSAAGRPLTGGNSGYVGPSNAPHGPMFLVSAPSPTPGALYSPTSSGSVAEFGTMQPLAPRMEPIHVSSPLLCPVPPPLGRSTPRPSQSNSLQDHGSLDLGPVSPRCFFSAPTVTAAPPPPPPVKPQVAATAAAQAALQAAATALVAAQQAAVTGAAGGSAGMAQVAMATRRLQQAQQLQQQVGFEPDQQQQLLQRKQQQQQEEEEALTLWGGLNLGQIGAASTLAASAPHLMIPLPNCPSPGRPETAAAAASIMPSLCPLPHLAPLPPPAMDCLHGEPLLGPLFSAPANFLRPTSGVGGTAGPNTTAQSTGYGTQPLPQPLFAQQSSAEHRRVSLFNPDNAARTMVPPCDALGSTSVGTFSLWPAGAAASSDSARSGGLLAPPAAPAVAPLLAIAPLPPRFSNALSLSSPQPSVGFEQISVLSRELPAGLLSAGPWAG